MPYGLTPITIVGNLPEDPEIRFTPSGHAVCKFRVLVTPRVRQAGGQGYEDGQASSYPCVAWRDLGESIANTFKQGMRVIVSGDWGQTPAYEDRNGVKRYPWELNVQAAGPELRFATAKVSKMERASSGAVSTPSTAGVEDDPWSTPAAATVEPAF